jgi:hypothetical protein
LVLVGVSTLTAQDWRGAPLPANTVPSGFQPPPTIAPSVQSTQYILPPPPPATGTAPARPFYTPPTLPRPLVPPSAIQPVQGQMPMPIPRQSDTDTSPISLDIPEFMRIFNRLDTEAALQERIRQEGRERDPEQPERSIIFPDEVTLTKEQYPGRHWPRQVCYAEPNYILYYRLYFQELNSERYGWDLGPISPLVSTMYFFRDVAMFPYNFGTDICRAHDSNAGYCLPGDPVPYLLYPIELSWTGTGVEAATIVTLLAVFP